MQKSTYICRKWPKATFFYIDTIIQGLILVHILPFIQNQWYNANSFIYTDKGVKTMDTQIEQLNLSSITKFALAYAGITTVSELKEYNYISLANFIPFSFLIRRIFLPINISSCFIFCSIPFHHAYEPILVLFALFYAICMMKRDLF